MLPRTMKAAVATALGAPLEIREVASIFAP